MIRSIFTSIYVFAFFFYCPFREETDGNGMYTLSHSKRLETKPEDIPDNTSPTKVLVTSLYVWCVFLLSAFTMTIVHTRLPDMSTYRPLPDIALDNIPRIPWAFQLSEVRKDTRIASA